MKAYKKLQTRYHEKVKAKWRAKIKCAVCSILVLFLVASFIGLVIGLSLGLERHTKCRKDYQHYCSTGCTDVRTDPLNCGDCGHTCDTNAGAVCLSRHCEFCTFNCSADNDFCTVEPCNSTAGCTIFDCANDGNPCTINPCNSTAGGCTPLDCANDGDYCTVGPCNPSAGGCAPRDCDALGDPCLTNPCTNGNCSYQCPGLQLNFPSTNYSTTVTGFTGIVPLGSSTARLTSVPNVETVTVSFNPALGGDTLSVTGSDANINVAFAGQTLTMTAVPVNGVPASNFQTLLRDVRYSCNNPGPGTRTVVFTYQVTNKKPRSLPSAVVATVTLNIP